MKKLSDSEFEVMKIIWGESGYVTSGVIMEKTKKNKGWKMSTINTMLSRLVNKGFITSIKTGKEREYIAIIKEDDYLSMETKEFLKKFHNNSLNSFFNLLYKKDELTKDKLEDLYNKLDKN